MDGATTSSSFDPPPDITDAQLQLLMPLRKDLGFVYQSRSKKLLSLMNRL